MRRQNVFRFARLAPMMLGLLLAGCGFPKSDVFKAFEAKTAMRRPATIPAAEAKAKQLDEQRPRWLPTCGGTQDNNLLRLDGINMINVPLNQRAAFISNAVVECTNLIITSGGTIVGSSSSGMSGYSSGGNVEDRTFTYETRKTVGTVMVLTTSIDASNLNVRFIMIEGRRAW